MGELDACQVRMTDFIVASPAAFNMAPVGRGKTAATLSALERLFYEGDVFSILVVAPARVAEHVWLPERDKWTPQLPMRIITGTARQRMAALMDPAPVHVIGRDNIAWLVEALGSRWPYDALVMDESQGFKDPGSKRFKSLRRVTKHHMRTVLMSATPASESLLGLWSQVFLLDRGERLGRSFSAYKQAYFESDYMGWSWQPRRGSEEKIFEKIADVSFAMLPEDDLGLPEPVPNVIKVYLSKRERETYDKLELDYLLPIRDGQQVTATNAAVLWGKLLQLAGGAVYAEDRSVQVYHTAKIAAFEDLVESANGNPLLVFYNFKHEAERIKAAVKGAEDLDVDRWNQGLQKVALAHPASAGAGLNLQFGGSLMCWYSLPSSLELYQQACGRLHRQGQTRRVIIHYLVTEGTIDEDILELLGTKAVGQDRLIAALVRRATLTGRAAA